jgi:hypothetical protein
MRMRVVADRCEKGTGVDRRDREGHESLPRREQVRGRAPCHARETPPVLAYMHMKDPSDLGRDSESDGEVAEAPQPHTVEAMCKTNWSARRRPTEGERATLERVATSRLEGPQEEAIASSRARGQNGVNSFEGPQRFGATRRARRLRGRDRTRSRPCARPTGLHKAVDRGGADHSKEGRYLLVLRGHLLGRRASHRQRSPGLSTRARAMSPRTAKTPAHTQSVAEHRTNGCSLTFQCHTTNIRG